MTVYDKREFSKKQESLLQMDRELKSLKAVYLDGKEKWKKKTLKCMASSIINEISGLKKIINLDEN